MELEEALSIINFDKIGTEKQTLEAYTVMFKEMYNVDVKNEDGTYKNFIDILKEASKIFNK